mmetsp:Transcript_15681/g.28741  ORF Transcript_15681/g.28741 Transcript_15681/m.28741 type:complete len:290 (+) Transcript_15681:129-998(+)
MLLHAGGRRALCRCTGPARRLGLRVARQDRASGTIAGAGPEAAAGVEVYAGHRKWHIRGMTAFAASQLLYWSVYTVDVLFWRDNALLANTFQANAKASKSIPNTAEGEKAKTGVQVLEPDSPVLKIYTHPAWAGVGAMIGIGCVVLLRTYARHLVSRIVLDKKGGKVYVSAHTALGEMAPAQKIALRDLKVLAPSANKAYILLGFPERQWNMIVDRSGTFKPPLGMTNADQVSKDTEIGLVAQSLGGGPEWLQSPGEAPVAPVIPKVSHEPPSLEELRRERLERQKRRK